MQATENQIERAKVTTSKSVLSFEQCLAIIIKQDLKKQPKPMSKKEIQQMNIRNSTLVVSSERAEELQAQALRNQASAM